MPSLPLPQSAEADGDLLAQDAHHQLTSKAIKKQYLWALATLVLGLMIGGSGSSGDNQGLVIVGGCLLWAGIIWLILTRVMQWWHHG